MGAVLNIQLIVQLMVLAGEIKTEAELRERLETLLKAYGLQYHGLLLQPRQDGDAPRTTLSKRWPDNWEEVYAERRYALVDPTIRLLRIAQRAFRWRDAVFALRNDPHRQRIRRMMQEGSRYGMQDGYIFPVHGRDGLLGYMSVAGRPVDLSPAEMALFEAATKRVFWRFLELRGQAEDLEAVPDVDTSLTRREMEIIGLLANGLTSNDIAKALDISNHTVDWYINGLQEKLKARNRQHVVASAFRLGLVM